MKALISKESSLNALALFGKLTNIFSDDMRSKLFELMKIYFLMKDQRILGIVPVLVPYKRMPPLFYILSGTEKMFYTVSDTLIHMSEITPSQDTIEAEEGNISDIHRRIDVLMKRGNPANAAEVEALRHQESIATKEKKGVAYTRGTREHIEYEILEDLDSEVRQKLLRKDDVSSFIHASLKIFNAISPSTISWERFQTVRAGDTNLVASPFPNYEMSVIDSFTQVTNAYVEDPIKGVILPFDRLRRDHTMNNTALNGKAERKEADEELYRLTERYSEQTSNANTEVRKRQESVARRVWYVKDL
jgi:hypothetical protein